MLVKDGVTELLADVFTALAHWRIFPAVYGAAMTAAAALLLSVYTTTVVVVAFLILLAVYNLNNVFDTDEDETNNPEQTEFVRQRRRWVYAVVAISTVAAVLLSLRGGSWTPILVVSVFVSGVVYSVESVRLKQVFPINTILVAVTLSTVAVGVPVAFAEGVPTPSVFVLFGLLCVRFAVTVELCNIPDIAGDRRAGVTTLPVVFGVQTTKRLIYAVEVGTFVSLVFVARAGLVRTEAVVVLGVPAVCSVVATHVTDRDPPPLGPGVYGDAQLLLAGCTAYVVV